MAYVECNTNPLPALDVTHNPELEHLTCGTCELTSLDLSKCPMLSHLDAFQNKLTSIDLSNNPKMKRLDIWDNPGLVNVDISSLKDLEFYNCAANGLTQLDVSNNPHLMALYCDWNNIPKLDLSKNPRLADLRCACNKLTELDISKNPQLYYLQIFGNNELRSININNNSRLRYLMKQVENGNVERVNDPNSQSYDMLLDLGGDHEYMDDMRYFISVAYNTEIVMDQPNDSADVYDISINTNDGLLKDAKTVTRGEAIQDLYIKAGSPSVSGSSRFTDVAGTAYENAVIWGEKNHLIFGSPNLISDTFKGNDAIARQDFALMYHRYAELVRYKSAFDYGRTDNFSDFFDMDYYAWGAFTWAIQWEILPKRGDHIYPHGRVTAEEMDAAYKTLLELNK